MSHPLHEPLLKWMTQGELTLAQVLSSSTRDNRAFLLVVVIYPNPFLPDDEGQQGQAQPDQIDGCAQTHASYRQHQHAQV